MSNRAIAAGNLSVITGEVVRPVILVYLDFASGKVRAHSAVGTIAWNGQNWFGVGSLGGIDPVEETSELEAYALKISISGVDPSNLSRVLGEQYQGRDAIIYYGLLSDDLLTLIADPIVLFKGTMDNAEITLGVQGTIVINTSSRAAAWDKPRELRYNDATQQQLFPGDKGLSLVEQATSKEITWGPTFG
jgi:hypothetical protein